MFWHNVLRKTGLEFCAIDNFPDAFVDFRFRIYTQGWSMSVKPSIVRCLSNVVVKATCNSQEKKLNIAVIK